MSSHIQQIHKDVVLKDYFIKFINPNCIYCSSCSNLFEPRFLSLSKGMSTDKCGSCRTKISWENADERRLLHSQYAKNNKNFKGGRTKGSKNKQPYPKVKRNFSDTHGHWNCNRSKIETQRKTWENKTDEELTQMIEKQFNTKIRNKTLTNYYQGRYKVKNTEKYIGDIKNVIYRSSWERATFKWLDQNDNIKYWAAEEVVIPYICESDKRKHRYYLDLWFQTREGKNYIVEIKPKSQTKIPKTPKRKTRRYIKESITYVKNQSKWSAASEFAADRGWTFEIWTEDTLKQLGIKILK